MNGKEPIVLFDSPEAAQFKTVGVWVSRHGRPCSDERCARYDGCTHYVCEECGQPYPKTSYCIPCHDKMRRAIFDAMPKMPWDTTTPLVIFNTDIYFFDVGDLLDYCADNEVPPESLPLVLCVPKETPELDPDDFFWDVLGEGGDVPGEIVKAAEAFNAAVQAAGPLSWCEGTEAAIVTAKDIGYEEEKQ